MFANFHGIPSLIPSPNQSGSQTNPIPKMTSPILELRKLKANGQWSDLRRLVNELTKAGYPKSILGSFASEEVTSCEPHPYIYPWHQELRDLGGIQGSPLVSIIVVSYNSGRDLLRLLPSLTLQSYLNWELVLIENGDEDTYSLVQDHVDSLRYVQADNPGFAEGNNIGLEYASGELLLLLNPDTELQRETLKELVHAISIDNTAAAASPRIFFSKPFTKITVSSKRHLPFTLDIAPILIFADYKKFFVREGTLKAGSIVESDQNSRISLDIAIDELSSSIEFLLHLSDSSCSHADVAVDFEGSGETPFHIDATLEKRLYKIDLSRQIHSASRYLINNCGSGIRAESREVFDVGFGEVDHGQYGQRAYRDAFCGCCVLLRRDLFVARKIFISEFFAYFEDSELSFWIRSNKMNILYVPSAIVYHRHSESTSEGSRLWNTLVKRSSIIYQSITSCSGQRAIDRLHIDYMQISEGKHTGLTKKLSAYDAALINSLPAKLISAHGEFTIGIYNSYWSSLGGGEKHALDFACLAMSLGYKVYLISEKRFSRRKLAMYYNIDLEGIKKLISSTISETLTQRFDVFVNSTYQSNLVSRATKSYYIVSFPHKNVSQEFLASYLFLHNSSFTQEWAKTYWGEHSMMVINPILGFCKEIAKKPFLHTQQSAQKERIIFSVGRFNYDGHCKNQHLIANMFKNLLSNRFISSDWKLVIAGSVNHTERSSTRHLSDVCGILDGLHAEVLPNASREVILCYYQRSSIYIHATGLGSEPERSPEKFEHFGISVFEALVNGCIPVVHKDGGPAGQLRNVDDAYIFSSNDDMHASVRNAVFKFESMSQEARKRTARQLQETAVEMMNYSVTAASALLSGMVHEKPVQS